jgi:hypothetical protein
LVLHMKLRKDFHDPNYLKMIFQIHIKLHLLSQLAFLFCLFSFRLFP